MGGIRPIVGPWLNSPTATSLDRVEVVRPERVCAGGNLKVGLTAVANRGILASAEVELGTPDLCSSGRGYGQDDHDDIEAPRRLCSVSWSRARVVIVIITRIPATVSKARLDNKGMPIHGIEGFPMRIWAVLKDWFLHSPGSTGAQAQAPAP